MKYVLAVACCFMLCTGYAQRDTAITRQERQVAGQNDTNACKSLCGLSYMWRNENLDSSLKRALRAVALSEQLHFYTGLRCGYNQLGITYYSMNRYDDALAAFIKYRDACVITGDSEDLAWAYNNIGNVYIESGRYDITRIYYDSSLHVRELRKDTIGIANSYVNIGFFHKDRGNYLYALDALYRALKTLEKTNKKISLANCYTYIAGVYLKQKRYTLSNVFYDKAYELYRQFNRRMDMGICLLSKAENILDQDDYVHSMPLLLQALDIFTSLDDQRQIALCYDFIGTIHFKKHEYPQAVAYFNKALTTSAEIGYKRSSGSFYGNLAEALMKTGRIAEATRYAVLAIETAQSSGSRPSLVKAYLIMAELQAAAGRHAEAYRYHTLYSAVNDSVLNESSVKAIAEMQTRYETEKKDLEISNKTLALDKATLEISRRRIQLVILLLSAIAALGIGYLFYTRYKLRQKQLMDAALIQQQELRNKAIIEAEEKERIRIAKDLHDGVGQQLSAVKMNLSAYESSLPPQDGMQKDRFQALMNLIDDSVKEVRSVSHNMMPSALMRYGLAMAVREFVTKISATGALKVNLQIVGLDDRLEATMETVLYRVLQECVSNIIRHAQASEVHVQLIQHERHLTLMLEDNGVGFDSSKVNDFSGIGLKNIISRIQYLNGSIDFDSTPGRGTTVIIEVPLQKT